MAEEARLPVDIDAQPLVQAAAALQQELRSYREEIEHEQRLPSQLTFRDRAASRRSNPKLLGKRLSNLRTPCNPFSTRSRL